MPVLPFRTWRGKFAKAIRARACRKVASSQRTSPAAACMRRAARFTTSPMIVYSRRSALPTSPQKAGPLATPIEPRQPRAVRASRISRAASTARSASSRCARGGKPIAARSATPFSSTLSLLRLPSYRYRARCSALAIACDRSRGVSHARSGRLTKMAEMRRISASQPAWPADTRARMAPGRYAVSVATAAGAAGRRARGRGRSTGQRAPATRRTPPGAVSDWKCRLTRSQASGASATWPALTARAAVARPEIGSPSSTASQRLRSPPRCARARSPAPMQTLRERGNASPGKEAAAPRWRARPHCTARRASLAGGSGRSPPCQTARMASPANLTISPPCALTRSMTGLKKALRLFVRTSAPSGPASASRSVSAVKPVTSASRTAPGNRLDEGSGALESPEICCRATSQGT